MLLPLLATIALHSSLIEPAYVPSQTSVAVLPMLNRSGDKFEQMKKDQIKEGEGTLNRLFGKRGFVMVPQDKLEKAIQDTGVDLSDEENWRKDQLYKIGQASGARLLIFTVITRTWQKSTESFISSRLEGFATLKTWLLDVQDKKSILSAEEYEGKSAKNGPTGSERQVRAVRIGLETQFKEFLKPYPETQQTSSGGLQ